MLVPAAEPASQRDLRRVRFGQFVDRAMRMARERGMTIPLIMEATGVHSSTFYRWRDGDWTKDPRASQVRAFCEGVGASTEDAYRALGWFSNEEQPKRHAEPIEDPDLRMLARKLMSPHTPAAEKMWIRRQIRALADEAERNKQ